MTLNGGYHEPCLHPLCLQNLTKARRGASIAPVNEVHVNEMLYNVVLNTGKSSSMGEGSKKIMMYENIVNLNFGERDASTTVTVSVLPVGSQFLDVM